MKRTESEPMPLFRLLLLIRDSRSTRNAERELLMALALRCNPAKNYVCWPSYSMLAKDTQLNEATLQRAAKKLEAAGLIQRLIRPNSSNRFFLNVARLQQQAAEIKAAEAMAKAASPESMESPFGTYGVTAEQNAAESYDIFGSRGVL